MNIDRMVDIIKDGKPNQFNDQNLFMNHGITHNRERFIEEIISNLIFCISLSHTT